MPEDAGSIYSEIRIKLDKLSSDIVQAESQIKKMGVALDAQTGKDSDKLAKNYTDSFSKINIGAAALAAGATAAFRSLVSTFAQTEQSLANVRAVTGASASEFEALRAAAVRAGDETRFSASRAADALYFLASGGLSAAQSIDALDGVLLLAGATRSDLAFTAETVTAVLSQYSLQAADAAKVSNIFAAATANSQATMQKLAVSLRTVGPIAGTLGISLEETTASLEALFNAGFTGETAGTALRDILLDLTNASGPVAEKLNALGISMESVNPKTVGLTKAISALGSSGATTEQLMAALGKTSGAQLAVLLKTGEKGLLDLEAAVTGTQEAAKQYAIQNDTLAGSFDEFASKAETAGNSLVETLTPAFRGVLGIGGAVLGFLSSLPAPLLGVLSGATALGGGVLALNAALGLFSITLGAVLGPVSLVAAGIGAVAIGISAAYQEARKLEAIRIDEEFGAISTQVKAAGENIDNLSPAILALEDRLDFLSVTGMASDTKKILFDIKKVSEQFGISERTLAKIAVNSSMVDAETKKIVDSQFKITEELNKQVAANRYDEMTARGRALLAQQEAEARKETNRQIGDQSLLTKQLAVLDKLVAQGLITEAEGLKKKIQLRESIVDTVQKEVLTTGAITASQATQLRAQNTSLEIYKERLKVLETTEATELEILKARAQLEGDALALFKTTLEDKAIEFRKAGITELEIEKWKLGEIEKYQKEAADKEKERKDKEEQDQKDRAAKEVEDAIKKYEILTGYALGFASAVVSLFNAINTSRTQDIKEEATASKKALDAEFKARELAGEDKTALDEEYQARKAKIDEDAAKETAELQYRSAVASWWLRQAEFLAGAPVAVVRAMGDLGLPGAILAGATIALQEGALIASYPKPPKFETGGMVIGQGGSGGALVQVAENGSTEAIFNSGAAGRPMMEAFADLVAERIQGQSQTINLMLDRKIISTAVVDDINNGRVRVTR